VWIDGCARSISYPISNFGLDFPGILLGSSGAIPYLGYLMRTFIFQNFSSFLVYDLWDVNMKYFFKLMIFVLVPG